MRFDMGEMQCSASVIRNDLVHDAYGDALRGFFKFTRSLLTWKIGIKFFKHVVAFACESVRSVTMFVSLNG